MVTKDAKEVAINIKVSVAMKKRLYEMAREKSLSLSSFCRMKLNELLDKR